MGSSSAVIAEQVYDYMQGVAVELLSPYFTIDELEFTDRPDSDTVVERKYALIKQFNTALQPHRVSGCSRKQLVTLIIEANFGKGQAQQGRAVETAISHAVSGTSFEHDINIDSITTNTYDNASGVKTVVVIDFNYLVRV